MCRMQKDTHAGSVILVATILVVFIFDQLVKRWVSVGVSTNEGIAFSLPFPRTLLIALSLLIVAVAIGWWVKNREKTTRDALALGLFIGGAFGNLADRIARGAVVDYLNIWNGSFNLADAAIVAGILLLIFRHSSKSGTISP